MGFFTDFLIAEPEEAREIVQAIAVEGTPLSDWEGFGVQAVSDLDLATLFGLLEGRAPHDNVLDLLGQFTPLSEQPDIHVLAFPATLTQRLAELAREQYLPLATLWTQADEYKPAADVHDSVELLAQICELARSAMDQQRSVLVCISGR